MFACRELSLLDYLLILVLMNIEDPGGLRHNACVVISLLCRELFHAEEVKLIGVLRELELPGLVSIYDDLNLALKHEVEPLASIALLVEEVPTRELLHRQNVQ